MNDLSRPSKLILPKVMPTTKGINLNTSIPLNANLPSRSLNAAREITRTETLWAILQINELKHVWTTWPLGDCYTRLADVWERSIKDRSVALETITVCSKWRQRNFNFSSTIIVNIKGCRGLSIALGARDKRISVRQLPSSSNQPFFQEHNYLVPFYICNERPALEVESWLFFNLTKTTRKSMYN
jgi:hypothetical protein